ncbi:MAG: hypothetical protein AAFY26_21675 [Cyanobacteria bacterium J06638_22]
MSQFDTQSERDFYDFCSRQGWTATKLHEATEPGVRTPDFLVRTQTDYEFVAEVTEFESEEPLIPGEIRVRGHILGNPLRAKLNGKKTQVKTSSKHFPTLIVVCGGSEHSAKLEPISFDAALYGEMAITVFVPHDPRRAPTFDDEMHNAGRRFFGATHNTSVSAVAALDLHPQRLRIYHNKFAKLPLDTSRTKIGTSSVEHYTKGEGTASGWIPA